ncbi:McrA Restriction endonuclease [uncultured Caudovirales phage]|uniref:McrA Restriction endonuclease n=1 Tax=uncultured Caudovirales phage TaxID=2100421 RepID=A0A6J5NWT8_9CAUD|nr:McrA Restriction endonuclease [uncultured Caudovirales phage]
MALATLKPRIGAAMLSRVKTLDTKAGATPRERGGKWTAKRKVVLLQNDCMCANGCGRVADEVDHDTPLEQGGSNDLSNLRGLCRECHAEKTKQEARQRHGKV